eukprot:gene8151-8991_t
MTTTSPIILSTAPMMQWTDRHWRYFMRLITNHTLLYTEMIMDNALIHNPENLEPFLGHHQDEHPLAVQLGGNDPERLAEAAQLVDSYQTFHEINLNSGCPSNKAKKGGFGAELMLDPDLVRRIVYEMKRRVIHAEVTVKCRMGVTGRESFQDLVDYLHSIRNGGVRRVILHARNCILKGLSPAQNRNVPPLQYEAVHRIVKLFPDMQFILNGGIVSFDQASNHLHGYNIYDDYEDEAYSLPAVHGVMIGREAYNNPFSFRHADKLFFPQMVHDDSKPCLRGDILTKYLDYAVDAQERELPGSNTCNIIKPLHNFFTNCDGNVIYKQCLDQMLLKESKLIDTGKVRLDDFVWRCVDSSGLDKTILWEDLPDRPRYF